MAVAKLGAAEERGLAVEEELLALRRDKEVLEMRLEQHVAVSPFGLQIVAPAPIHYMKNFMYF